MIELDGVDYNVKSVDENMNGIIDYINDYAQSNSVTNSLGQTIYIDNTPTNPLAMIVRGLSYLVHIIQSLLYNLGCGMNIQQASERQLLNLADMAGIKRGQATKTTIDLLCYASSAGSCQILTTNGVTLDNHTYYPAFDSTIAAGGVAHIVLICEDSGSYTISEDVMTGFDDTIENLDRFKQYKSIPGQEQETVAALRERMQRRTTSGTNLDAAMDAIRGLAGVTLCNIYFNDSVSSEITVNGITIQPRAALLLVQGYNDAIAETFYQHLNCPTTAYTTARTLTQTYTTHAQQQFTVYIVEPVQTICYVTIYCNKIVTQEVMVEMKQAVQTLTLSLTAGQTVTAAMVLGTLSNYMSSCGVQGATVGKSSAVQSYQIKAEPDELFTFELESIVIDITEAV